MRILFMGTPDFAVASLKALIEAGHEICGVFTQLSSPSVLPSSLPNSPKEKSLASAASVNVLPE